jgi:hypothetical protein
MLRFRAGAKNALQNARCPVRESLLWVLSNEFLDQRPREFADRVFSMTGIVTRRRRLRT